MQLESWVCFNDGEIGFKNPNKKESMIMLGNKY